MTGIESSELGWRDVLWSVAIGIAAAFLLFPLFASIAHGQTADGAPSTDSLAMLLGVAGPVAWPFGLALGTEFLRSVVPAWRRGVRADPKALAAVDRVRAALAGQEAESLEMLRRLAVATGGPSDSAKTVLRIVPVAAGVLAGLAGLTPAFGGGAHAELFGGIVSGFFAALFGGSLVKAVRDRLDGDRRAP